VVISAILTAGIVSHVAKRNHDRKHRSGSHQEPPPLQEHEFSSSTGEAVRPLAAVAVPELDETIIANAVYTTTTTLSTPPVLLADVALVEDAQNPRVGRKTKDDDMNGVVEPEFKDQTRSVEHFV
jgi:hypothetical protein